MEAVRKIRIDFDYHPVERRRMFGTQILALAGKDAKYHGLNKKLPTGARHRIEPDDIVDTDDPGIDRFETFTKQMGQG